MMLALVAMGGNSPMPPHTRTQADLEAIGKSPLHKLNSKDAMAAAHSLVPMGPYCGMTFGGLPAYVHLSRLEQRRRT